MGISVRIKEVEFPQWVNDIYENMTIADREVNTKANIYGVCHHTDDDKFKIATLISGLSNRVPILPDAKSVAIAISLADMMYPHTFLPGDTQKAYTCKHCQFKFDSHEKDPSCPSCQKWAWELSGKDSE